MPKKLTMEERLAKVQKQVEMAKANVGKIEEEARRVALEAETEILISYLAANNLTAREAIALLDGRKK